MKRMIGAAAAAAFLVLAVPAFAQLEGSPSQRFVEAVRKGDGNTVGQLLDSNPDTLLNARDYQGDTALLVAIDRRDDDWTAFLLSKGADPNLASRDGKTPLIAAARIGYDDAVGWLIGKGAKVDSTNRMGETALIVAVQQRQPLTVKILLSAGADPDKTDGAAGLSARDYARRDSRARDILRMIELSKPKSGK